MQTPIPVLPNRGLPGRHVAVSNRVRPHLAALRRPSACCRGERAAVLVSMALDHDPATKGSMGSDRLSATHFRPQKAGYPSIGKTPYVSAS